MGEWRELNYSKLSLFLTYMGEWRGLNYSKLSLFLRLFANEEGFTTVNFPTP